MKYSDMFLQSVNDHTAKIQALRNKLNDLDMAAKITVYGGRNESIHSVRGKDLELYKETLKDNIIKRINELEEQLQATLENNK